jgi:MHS family alpha-ketoglutarate permease-like MFS transporter
MQSPVANPPRAGRLRSILGGSLGNLVEWYDWYVYSAFTLYFAPAFFPSDDSTVQLLNAAAIFAVGFLMRPLGAWLMGMYADRKGRKAGLTVSVMLMGGGSLMIAATPAYATIGVAAPMLLLLARLLQGLSVGGEYGASATYLSEMAQRDHRGFFSSFQYVTLIAGQLLALMVLLLLQMTMLPADLELWGWRIPFAIGGLLAVSVFWLRRRLAETPQFESGRGDASRPRSSGLALIRHLVNSAGFGRETATGIMAAALFIYMLLQPAAGWLSDRVGRKPLLIGFGVAGLVFTVPLLMRIERAQSSFEAFLLVMFGLVIVTGYTSINAVVKAELFPANIRALGVALPYALANTVFGGTAEYVALSFKSSGIERGFYWYVAVTIGLSLIVYARMAETRGEVRD